MGLKIQQLDLVCLEKTLMCYLSSVPPCPSYAYAVGNCHSGGSPHPKRWWGRVCCIVLANGLPAAAFGNGVAKSRMQRSCVAVAAAGTAMGNAPAASNDKLVAAMWLARALCPLLVVVVMTIVQDVLLRCGGQLGQ
jgi:hypothetical protein